MEKETGSFEKPRPASVGKHASARDNSFREANEHEDNPAPKRKRRENRSAKAPRHSPLKIILLSTILIIAVILTIFAGKLFRRSVTIFFDCNAPAEELYCAPEAQSLPKGEKVSCPPYPIRDGFKFVGWYTDAECTEEFDFHTAPTESMTLYAKWIDADSPEAQLTEADVALFEETMDAFDEICAPYYAENGYIPETQQSMAVDLLEKYALELLDKGVISYLSREGDTLYVELPSGLNFAHCFSTPGKSSAGLPEIITMGVEPFVQDPDAGFDLPWGTEIWMPLPSILSRVISLALPDHTHDALIYMNADVTYTKLQDAEPASVVLWDGHGLHLDKYGPVLLTSEYLGEDNDGSNTFWRDSKYKVSRLAKWGEYTTVNRDHSRYIAFTPRYIEKYFNLENALVYLSACESGKNNDNRLADAFIAAGAETVFFNAGTEEIYTWYTETMMYTVISYMIGWGPVVENGVIADEADGIFHPASEALEKAEEFMKAYADSEGIAYDKSCFVPINTGSALYTDTHVELSQNSRTDYTICSGITGKLISTDQSIDFSRISLALTGPSTCSAGLLTDGRFYFNDLPYNDIHDSLFGKTMGTMAYGEPYQLTILYDGEPLRIIDSIYVSEHKYTDLKEIDLSGQFRLSVAVTDDQGAFLPNADITADNGNNTIHLALSSSGDLYQTFVQQGPYTLQISVPGYYPKEDAARIKEDTTLQYEMTPAGIVSGKVTRSDNAKPVRFATVTLVSEDGSVSYKATADLSGEYSFKNIKPGVYQLACSRKTFQKWETTIRLDPNETMEIEQNIALTRIQIGMVLLKLLVGVVTLLVCARAIFSSFRSFSGTDFGAVGSLLILLLKVVCVIALIGTFWLLVTGGI